MPMAGLAAMRVPLGFEFNGDHKEASVPHATFGDDLVSEVLNVARVPPQRSDFHTTLMVEMHMHRRQRQVMMIVERAGEPFR
jgi:hypothetical protein